MFKNKTNFKNELLAPAGSLEKLKYALYYGADAVYCGLPDISMRARVNSFSQSDLEEAIELVHAQNKKIYITLNIYAHNYHLSKIEEHLKFLRGKKIDALIISDPGILLLAQKYLPEVDVHLSTQANTTNWQAAKFWQQLGVKRIVLARETTLKDIEIIHQKLPDLELEYFVHGAMCMSYSGRCILSKWMSGKSANLGDCSQPCRWAYQKASDKNLEQRQQEKILLGELTDVQNEHEIQLEQDDQGTYFFNSKDLNLLCHLDKLHQAGVTSFKIEGRNKSVFYVASVVRAYRTVLDALEENLPRKEVSLIIEKQAQELNLLVHRGYTEGFLFENEPEHNFSCSHEIGTRQFVGEVLDFEEGKIKIKAHNVIRLGDQLEIMQRKETIESQVVEIFDEDGQKIESAHGGQDKLFYLELKDREIAPERFSLIRKKIDKIE